MQQDNSAAPPLPVAKGAEGPALDAVCRVAASLFGTPFASVTVLDGKSPQHTRHAGTSFGGLEAEDPFCDWVDRSDARIPLVVRDTRSDPRFAGHPLVVGGPKLRFYAGVPLRVPGSDRHATLCIADTAPGLEFGPPQLSALVDLALLVEVHLRLRDMHDLRAAEAQTLRASEERLRISEERLALALDGGTDGLIDLDLAPEAEGLVDAPEIRAGEGVRNASVRAFLATVHPEDRAAVAARLHEHQSGAEPTFDAEYRRLDRGWGWHWVLSRARVVDLLSDGRARRLIGTTIDISRRKQAEVQLVHQASHDALTGLPNRTLFRRHLKGVLAATSRTAVRSAVLTCDLDRFKAVNDTLGHLAGDELLRVAARRIRAVVRDGDMVAHLGGDEFALVLSDLQDEGEVRSACDRIITAIGRPISLDGLRVDIGVSIGVAPVFDDGATEQEMFKRADLALYQAKAAGRNRYCFFEAEAQARTTARSRSALDLKDALRRGEFSLVYQPVVDVTTDSVVSFEALMRWSHPTRGLVSPSEFIPVAEETGLIVQLGTWALAQACLDARAWPSDVRVSVNVSTVQFRYGLEEAVAVALSGSGLEAERLKLEVTESLLMADSEQAAVVLHRLKVLGVRIALDDFGTGYSSLSYLRRFPFDKLKIDRSFIRDIGEPDAAAIVKAVVDIGVRLGMTIVAEGVETVEQLDLVKQAGCTEVQGYLFSKPLTAPDAIDFLAHFAK